MYTPIISFAQFFILITAIVPFNQWAVSIHMRRNLKKNNLWKYNEERNTNNNKKNRNSNSLRFFFYLYFRFHFYSIFLHFAFEKMPMNVLNTRSRPHPCITFQMVFNDPRIPEKQRNSKSTITKKELKKKEKSNERK